MVKNIVQLKDEITGILARVIETEKRLSALEHKRLAAGNGIRLTENDSNTVCINTEGTDERPSETYAEPTPDTADISPGYGIIIDRNGTGFRIGLDPAILPDRDTGVFFSKEQDFPFKVRINGLASGNGNSTQLTVCGGVTSCVFAGTYPAITVGTTSLTVTQACYIVLKITTSLNSVNAVMETKTVLPAVSDTVYYVPIAWISYDSGYAEVHQMHYGNVFVAGRII